MCDYWGIDDLSARVGIDDAKRLLKYSYWTGHGKRPVLESEHAEDLMSMPDGSDDANDEEGSP
jgi:hypothetical protein